MRIYLIAVGERMPAWVTAGFEEYRKRLGPECMLQLVEIPPEKRGSNQNTLRILQKEADRIMAAVPRDCHIVALERQGKSWSTENLADKLRQWLQGGRDIALLIGGPEGLADEIRQRADELWSLSALTFPHPLVRVMVAEQVYRAYSILKNHPYHK
jgi:23S rRNA (pseudouridine1915-N3)-methyltransferase